MKAETYLRLKKLQAEMIDRDGESRKIIVDALIEIIEELGLVKEK